MCSRLKTALRPHVKIELTCQSCGENRFSLSDAETDDALVNCVECGHEVGTLGSLKSLVERAVMDSIRERPSIHPEL